jgi:hypothetical protein
MLSELNSIQITEILRKDKCTQNRFIGVFARDELPTRLVYPCCFVLNTHTSDLPGEHWLALHYDVKKICHFYDSYGLHPDYYSLTNYITRTSSGWYFNSSQSQSFNSFICGYYCVLFLMLKCRKLDYLIYDFKDKHINYIFT